MPSSQGTCCQSFYASFLGVAPVEYRGLLHMVIWDAIIDFPCVQEHSELSIVELYNSLRLIWIWEVYFLYTVYSRFIWGYKSNVDVNIFDIFIEVAFVMKTV